MAIDLSLRRLRELLESVPAQCDEAQQLIDSILGSFNEHTNVRDWTQENSQSMESVWMKANAIKRATVNAEMLCERLELVGDAGYLGDASKKFSKSSAKFDEVYRLSINKTPTFEVWRKQQTAIWTMYADALYNAKKAAGDTLASQLLESPEVAEALEANKAGSKRKRPGRKKADYKTVQKEAALAARWTKSLGAGISKADFAKDHRMTQVELNKLLNRVYSRKKASE